MSNRLGVFRDDYNPIHEKPRYLQSALETWNCLFFPSFGRYTEIGIVNTFPLAESLPLAEPATTGHNHEVAVNAKCLASTRCIHAFRTGSLGGRLASSGVTRSTNTEARQGPAWLANGVSAPMLRSFDSTLNWSSYTAKFTRVMNLSKHDPGRVTIRLG